MTRPQRSIAGGFALLAVTLATWVWGTQALRPSPQAAGQPVTVASDVEPVRRNQALSAGALRASASLEGRVVTEADGAMRPVAEALVCISCGNCEPIMAPPPRCVRADAQGQYALLDVVAGGYRVTAQRDGYAPGRSEPALVFVEGDEQRVGVDVVMREGGVALVGHVLDATGGPVPHANVRAIRLFEPAMTLAVEADRDGRFEFNVPPGSLTLEASAEGYAPVRIAAVAPSQAVELRLLPASRISGHVRSARDGSLVAGIEVRAAPSSNPYAPVHRAATTDEDGAFSIDGLEPGRYALTASGPGYRGARSQEVALALADVVRDADITVDPAVRVRGRVMIGNAQPCRRGFVTLGPPGPEQLLRRRPSAGSPVTPGRVAAPAADAARPIPMMMAMIGPNGDVLFEGATAGHYFASVQCSDHVLHEGPEEIDVALEDVDDLDWRVKPGLGLRVAVVDGADRAVPHAAFSLRFPTVEGRTPVMPIHADADGRFEFPGFMHAGSYQLRPSAPFVGEAVDVELRDGMAVADVTLRIAGSAMIQVVVRDQEDVRVDQLHVSASPVVLGPVSVATTSVASAGVASAGGTSPVSYPAAALGDGRYQIAPLPAGTYQVRVSDGVNAAFDGSGSETADDHDGLAFVDLEEGAVHHVSLTIHRGAQIAGVVQDAQGEPVANAWVAAVTQASEVGLRFGGPAPARVLTDYSGRFSITRLTPGGRYRVQVDEPNGGVAVANDVPATVEHDEIRLTVTQPALALAASSPP